MIKVNGITGPLAATASSSLELQLLGAPQLRLDTQPLHEVLTGKPLALLLYLAVTGQPHTRDALAMLLWSELSIQQARNNLRYTLPLLRRTVASYVSITTRTISFNRQAPYWQDVEVLRTTLQGNLAAIPTAQLQTVLDLYQGEFLAGFRVRNAPAFVAWLTTQRQQLHALTLQGLLHLAERQLTAHKHTASQLTRQRILTLIPQGAADLPTALSQSGIALDPYQHLIPWLKTGDLFLSTAAGSAGELYTAVSESHSEQAITQPGPAADQHDSRLHHLTNSTLCHNLPSQLTPFFGREQEMTEIMVHLTKATYRLLTLTGEGGVGKTRLALAIAQSMIDCAIPATDFSHDLAQVKRPAALCHRQFQDGVWFVPLAQVSATADLPNQIAAAIAKAIQLPLNDQDTLLAQIIHYFAHKRTLLILDNFEQLNTGVPIILDLLHGTTALKILITSRHRLHIQAEYPWRLTGLPVPPLPSSATPPLIAQQEYAGIALFTERARRAQPGFELEAQNLPAVIQICHFVQGLPLGLELAATLMQDYTCAEVWEILRHNYHILATTLPDLPARHRNIKIVLDHSWRFLCDEEARALAGCSVFYGPFARVAAVAITGVSPEVIARLIDQSLLHWTAETAGYRWLNLHELVRQYAAEQLAATPAQRRQVQAQHAAYYMRQVQQAEAALPRNGAVFQQMHQELANLHTAWLWSCEAHQWPLVEQGLQGITRLYRLAGLYHDAIQILQAAINAMRPLLPALATERQPFYLFPQLLINAAEFCRHLGWLDEGERLAQEALDWGCQFDDVTRQGEAYHELAHLAQRRGQHLLMHTLAEAAARLAQQALVPRLAAKSLTILGAAELLCGNPTQSTHYYEAALRALTEAPDPELEAVIQMNLGAGHLSCHNYALARRYLTRAFVINQSLHTPYKNGPIYVFSGILWLALGAYDQARQDYRQALTIFKEVYEPYWESWGRAALAHLLKQGGETTEAALECERVLTLVKGRIPVLEHCALSYLGDIRYQQGDWGASEAFYRQALGLQQQAHLRLRLAEPAVQLAYLLLERNEAAVALSLLEEPLATLHAEGLGALAEPFVAYWVGYQVLKANADVRAHPILQEAYQRLRQQAAQIDDASLRHSFLEQVVANRRLRDAAHAAGLS